MNASLSVTFDVVAQQARLFRDNTEVSWDYDVEMNVEGDPADHVPVPVIVSVLASATGREPNSAGGENEWWRLDLPITEEWAEKNHFHYEDEWSPEFSFSFVGECDIATADTYVVQTFDHEHEELSFGHHVELDQEVDEEELAFLLAEGFDDPRANSKFLGGSVSKPRFRPEDDLGFTLKEALEDGYSPEDYWYVRAKTGPGEGMYLLEFRSRAIWQRPTLQRPSWS